MVIVDKAALVKKGVVSLQDAERSVAVGEYREAEVEIGIANAYARLADALGDKRISINDSIGNW